MTQATVWFDHIPQDYHGDTQEAALTAFAGSGADASAAVRYYAGGEEKDAGYIVDLGADVSLAGVTLAAAPADREAKILRMTVACRGEREERYRVIGAAFGTKEQGAVSLTLPDVSARYLTVKAVHTRFLPAPLPQITGLPDTGSEGSREAAFLEAELRREPLSVDVYGQCMYLDWPGKVTSDGQLRQELQQEQEALKDVRPDAARFDRYGGLLEEPVCEATGFFYLKKLDGVWWFITPEGHRYIMKGMDLACYDEFSYYTPLNKKDTQEIRECYAPLPTGEQAPDLYDTVRDGDISVDADGRRLHPGLSFLQYNLTKKYGTREFVPGWTDLTRKRLLNWHFNGLSKWKCSEGLGMPYTRSLHELGDYIRIGWVIDPFDPDFERKMRPLAAAEMAPCLKDPYLIGYHFSNEIGWTDEIVAMALQDGGTLPAKRAFVDFIRERYHGSLAAVNCMLGTEADSFEALADQPLSADRLPACDQAAFIRLASREFHRKARNVIKSIDPDHLFLGSALTPDWHSCYDYEVGGAEFCDAISLDFYTSDGGAFLNRYIHLDKPLLNIEFSFTSLRRGHGLFLEQIHGDTDRERGEMYRDFVEGMFRVPQFVGTGYFILYDQPTSGRANGDGSPGEPYNFGLLNLQDQPYAAMIREVAACNAGLEQVHASGKRSRE